MQGIDEINYYLIQDPFGEREIIAYDHYEVERVLNEFSDGLEIKRILRVPKKRNGQEIELLSFESELAENFKKESQRLRGWKHFFRIGIGGTITYLALPNLFSFGMSIPFRIFGPWRGIIPTEIQLGSYILGIAAAIIPYLYIRNRTHSFSIRGTDLKKYSRLMRNISKVELRTIEDGKLREFQNASVELINKTRNHVKELQNGEQMDRITACLNIQRNLEEFFRQSKLHKLKGLDEYIQNLLILSYRLQKKLEKPRFWSDYKKYTKNIIELSSRYRLLMEA